MNILLLLLACAHAYQNKVGCVSTFAMTDGSFRRSLGLWWVESLFMNDVGAGHILETSTSSVPLRHIGVDTNCQSFRAKFRRRWKTTLESSSAVVVNSRALS